MSFINAEDFDEIIDKSSAECSYNYFLSYKLLRLIFNGKVIDEEDNKTKNKVFKYTSFGWFLFLRRVRKKGYK